MEDLRKDLDKIAAQLELFKNGPMPVQSAITRLELIDSALMVRISMLELRVAELEKAFEEFKD